MSDRVDKVGPPTLAHVLAVLRGQETALRKRGILHAGVFGSVADDAGALKKRETVSVQHHYGEDVDAVVQEYERLAARDSRALLRQTDHEAHGFSVAASRAPSG